MTKISIIVPHYNSEEKLMELLKTIPIDSQIETIIIDDSSKNQKELEKKIGGYFGNIYFLKNDTGIKGAGSARNIGLKNATGEWIVFADADDVFTANAFKILKEYIETDSDIVYFKPTSFIENTNYKSKRHLIYKKLVENFLETKNLKSELELRYLFVVPWSKMIRRNIIHDNNIFFEETLHSNDILFSAKTGFYAKKLSASKEVIYSVRENKNSLTSSMNEESFRIRFQAWIKYNVFIKEKLKPEEHNLLDTSGMFQFGRIYNNNLSINNYFYVIKECIKNNIPIFNKRIFNLKYVFNYFKSKK